MDVRVVLLTEQLNDEVDAVGGDSCARHNGCTLCSARNLAQTRDKKLSFNDAVALIKRGRITGAVLLEEAPDGIHDSPSELRRDRSHEGELLVQQRLVARMYGLRRGN